MLAILIVAIGIFTFGAVCASAETEGIYTYSVSNVEATITGCDTYASGDIVIPDTLGGYPVTHIGESAFLECKSITGITISDGVKVIKRHAVRNCDSLKSIYIPASVTSIDWGAFAECDKLEKIEVNEANEYYVVYEDTLFTKDMTTIVQYAIAKDSDSYIIPSTVTKILTGAFYNCYNLKNIYVEDGNNYFSSSDGVLFDKNKTTLVQYPVGKSDSSYNIPDGISQIGERAFLDCRNLKNIVIPSDITKIDAHAFNGCTSLESITIPGSVTSIYNHAFYNCNNLVDVTIPSGVVSIGNYAFYGCSSLSGITIPDGVTNIGVGAFYGCSCLTTVAIPDSITNISIGTFYRCSNLATVTIPDSITSIGNYAFSGCDNLTDVYYNGTAENWNKISVGDYNLPIANAKIHFVYTKTTLSNNAKTFTIKPINVEIGKTVLLALYNGEKFVEMQSAVYAGEAICLTTDESYTKAKVMVWDGLESLKPVCGDETVLEIWQR